MQKLTETKPNQTKGPLSRYAALQLATETTKFTAGRYELSQLSESPPRKQGSSETGPDTLP
jgi:hypothetical protein